MEKFNNDKDSLEDILASLDDEDIRDDDLTGILSELDSESEQVEISCSSFDDYASKLIKEMEDELNEEDDNLSSLSSMFASDDESNQNSDDILSILENLDSLEENNENDLEGVLSELDNHEEVEEESIEDLFNQFIEAVKNLSNDEKDALVDTLKEIEK